MKAEKTTEIIYTEERVPLLSAGTLIESLPHQALAAAEAHVERLVDEESASLAGLYRLQKQREWLEAQAAHQVVCSRLEARRAERERALALLEEVEREPYGCIVKAAISAACAVACFVAEFVLTWNALTFLLSVEKHSFAGVMLGLAPACALGIVEVVLQRLLEQPWQRLQSAPASSSSARAALAAAMAVFLLVLAWGNLWTVLRLAEAREEASKIQRQLSEQDDGDGLEVNRRAITEAILAVSVCVTIDGALFLLICFGESRRFRRRRACRRNTAALRSATEELDSERLRAAAVEQSCRAALDEAEENGRLIAARFREQCRITLSGAAARKLCELGSEQQVEHALRMRFRFPSGGGR